MSTNPVTENTSAHSEVVLTFEKPLQQMQANPFANAKQHKQFAQRYSTSQMLTIFLFIAAVWLGIFLTHWAPWFWDKYGLF